MSPQARGSLSGGKAEVPAEFRFAGPDETGVVTQMDAVAEGGVRFRGAFRTGEDIRIDAAPRFA